jgi:hypothetical protein
MRLTDEKIAELWHEANGQHYKFARLVEVYVAELAEREKQEPIGYVFVEDDENYTGSMIYANKSGDEMLPVYLAPVSVEAAVLAEREACAKLCDDKHDYMCSRAAAAIRARGLK